MSEGFIGSTADWEDEPYMAAFPRGSDDLRLAEDSYPDKVSPLNTVPSFRFEHTANQNLAFANCLGKFVVSMCCVRHSKLAI